MIVQPKLTVCVPSRNRQRYFQETIRSLLANMRMDVEYIFADNSDDPAPMRDFIKDVIDDPRVTFIPPAGKVLSMVDNWERCMEKATGEFVCFIGDDDYIDVNVIDLINRTQAQESAVDVFVWSRLTYNWPNNRPNHCNVCVPLGTYVVKFPRQWLAQEFFGWQQHKATPNCPFAIYHGAISLKAMKRIKQKFGGRFFEHPTVDFENISKLLVTADSFFYCERPFSVLGSCPESNSARIKDIEKLKEQHAQFMKEVGRNIDDDPYMRDFPFPSRLGIAAAVGQVQQWFFTTYGYGREPGWERNFAEACGVNCGMATDRASYEMQVEGYEKALSNWQGGKYLQYFKPVFVEPAGANFYTGVNDKYLYIDEDIAGVQTPAEIYAIANQATVPVADLELVFDRHFKAA